MPVGLAKTKQAISRGYAVAALSSLDRLDRRSAGGGRRFSWGANAAAEASLLRTLPRMLQLPPGALCLWMANPHGTAWLCACLA